MDKIVAYQELTELIKKLKGRRIVLVGGCFDILHLGHVRFLRAAKKYGTLIVALESDTNVRRYKGILRPIHKQTERAEVLTNLKTVDYVLLLSDFSTDQEYASLTTIISPNVIAVTEGDPQLSKKNAQAQNIGAEIIIIPKISTPSTSQLAKMLQIE